jgi:putative DNA primase/helicase
MNAAAQIPERTPTRSRYAVAVELVAEHGTPIFPCKPDKTPRTRNGFYNASTVLEQIDAWFLNSNSLIGVPTGGRFFVVDVDPAGVDWYTANAHRLNCGCIHNTRRGWHLLYATPAGGEIKNSAGQIAPGVDVRGMGGYAIWWPGEGLPATGSIDDIGPAPDWLLDLLATKPAKQALNGTEHDDRPHDHNGQHAKQLLVDDGQTIVEGGRNHWLTQRAGILWNAVTGSVALRAALHAENQAHCKPPLDHAEVETIVASAERNFAPPTRRAGGELLPEITLKAGDLGALVDQAADALRVAGASIYRRGTDLFRTSRLAAEDTGPVRREAGAVVLRFVDPEWLHVELARAATWRRFDAREKKPVPANPPGELARLILARSDDHSWPMLRAIARHPVVTLDGRLITAAGYDDGTGLLLDIAGHWQIPEHPSRDDAVAACALLTDLLRHFPWSSPADRAVALSLLVTAVMRPVLATAPMHCVDAPEAGSGKSLLVDAAAILATGRRAAVLEYGRNAEESGKRIDSALLAGDAVLALDNVEAPLEGAALCQTLTATSRSIRILGQSKNVTVPCSVLLTATGNNLVLRGDIVRRALVCRLDPETDRPELRRFDQDLLAETLARRPALVAAALTVSMAYLRAGLPDVGLTPLGSFEDWSSAVRAALVWAGQADACETMTRSRDVDPARQNLAAVFGAWHAHFGSKGATAAAAVALADQGADLRELRDVLAEVCERHGKLDSRALGTWLRSRRDTRAGSLVLRHCGTRARAAVWAVEDSREVSVVSVVQTFFPTPCEFVRDESIDGVTNKGEVAGKVHVTLTTLTSGGDIVEVVL